jgi:hypothetical protein
MKYILKQMAMTALCLGILYSVVLGITFIVMPAPPRGAGWLDLSRASDSLYLTAPKQAVLGRDVLDVPDRKVLLIGASNTNAGFRQEQVQKLVPCAKVSNLGVGSANITEVRQMIDIVKEVEDDAARRSNTFVIGVWFGMFADTELRWPWADRHRGDTDIDIERYRYGFYRRTAAGPVALLPPNWLRFEVLLIRPYLFIEKITRDATYRMRQTLFTRRQANLTDAEREIQVMSEKQKSTALDAWRQNMGGTSDISQAQVALLQDTIEELLRSGDKVVLADLPIPSWHRDASPYQPGYARAVQKMFDHFANRSGFTSLRMSDLETDLDYSDEVHPKPHLAKVWASRLAQELNPLVCPEETAADPEGTSRERFSHAAN